MANYLTTDTDLTSVANAIRTKGGTSAQLAFPAGFVSAIGDIPSGGGVVGQYNTYGDFVPNEIVYPSTVTDLRKTYNNIGGANNVISISGDAATTTAAPGAQFKGMANLETVNLPRGCHFYASAFATNYKLKTVTLGSVGHPVVATRNSLFQYDTQNDLTITMFVNASTLAEAQADPNVGALAPWGATNATIIFKSSTTGEVLV